jgi:nitrite reductase/ring-hydroxylating ferredoxin subunit
MHRGLRAMLARTRSLAAGYESPQVPGVGLTEEQKTHARLDVILMLRLMKGKAFSDMKKELDAVKAGQAKRLGVGAEQKVAKKFKAEKACFVWNGTAGSCFFGDACSFTHDQTGPGKETDKLAAACKAKGLCFRFQNGKCNKGDGCKFKHSLIKEKADVQSDSD